MAKKNLPVVEEVVEEVEEIEIDAGEEIDIEELEIDGVEEVVEETDEVEAELEEAAAPAETPKAKRTPPTNSTLKSIQPIGENEVGAQYIAELCGVDSREIRAYLRKNHRNMDAAKGERYRWPKGSKEIQAIIDGFKASKAGTAAPAVANTPAVKQTVAPATKPAAQVAAKPAAVATKPVAQATKPATVATKPAVATKPVAKK